MEFSDYFLPSISVNSSPSHTPFVSAPSSPRDFDSPDFDFSARFSDATHPGYVVGTSPSSPAHMSSAEELFLNGKIRPLNPALMLSGSSPQRASCSSCNYSEFLQHGFHQRVLCEGIYAQESALEIWKKRRRHERASRDGLFFRHQENAVHVVGTCRDMEAVRISSEMEFCNKSNVSSENSGSNAGCIKKVTQIQFVSINDAEVNQNYTVSGKKLSCDCVNDGEMHSNHTFNYGEMLEHGNSHYNTNSHVRYGKAVDSEDYNRLRYVSNGGDVENVKGMQKSQASNGDESKRDGGGIMHCCGFKNMLPSSDRNSDMHQKLDDENKSSVLRKPDTESITRGVFSQRLDVESISHDSESVDQPDSGRRSSIRPVGNAHRRARSLSPLRVFHMDDHHMISYRPSFEEAMENLAPGRPKRKTLKDLLRVSELTKAKFTSDTVKSSNSNLSVKAIHDNDSNNSSAYGKLQLKARPLLHHHHHHQYASQKAQEIEVLKRRTFLPYKHGLLGCLGFSSKGYSSSLKGLHILK